MTTPPNRYDIEAFAPTCVLQARVEEQDAPSHEFEWVDTSGNDGNRVPRTISHREAAMIAADFSDAVMAALDMTPKTDRRSV